VSATGPGALNFPGDAADGSIRRRDKTIDYTGVPVDHRNGQADPIGILKESAFPIRQHFGVLGLRTSEAGTFVDSIQNALGGAETIDEWRIGKGAHVTRSRCPARSLSAGDSTRPRSTPSCSARHRVARSGNVQMI